MATIHFIIQDEEFEVEIDVTDPEEALELAVRDFGASVYAD